MMLLQYGASSSHRPNCTAECDIASSPPPPRLQQTRTTSSKSNKCDTRIGQNSTNPHRPVRRTVAFKDDSSLIQIYEIPSKDEYTVEEWEAVYLTSHDYHRIQEDNWETLRMMRKNVFPSDEDYYFRGLEIQLPKARGQRQRRNRLAVKAILRYQKQQQWHYPKKHQNQNSNNNNNNNSGGTQHHYCCCIPSTIFSLESGEDISEISIHAAQMLALWDHTIVLEDDDGWSVSGDRVNGTVGCDI
jgi:hypothetical protein